MHNAYQYSPRRAKAPLPWKLIVLLGAFALIRPLMHITGVTADDGGIHAGVAAISATVMVSAVWIGAAVIAKVQRPFLTLVLVGLTYAVLSMILSTVLSPLLTGQLQGPFANPIAIPAVLTVNAIWGAAAGAIAMVFARFRKEPQ